MSNIQAEILAIRGALRVIAEVFEQRDLLRRRKFRAALDALGEEVLDTVAAKTEAEREFVADFRAALTATIGSGRAFPVRKTPKKMRDVRR